MGKVVILGAGLTGLSTAYHLEQNNFSDFTIFEKQKTVGGLCRSVKHDGFTFDYTGHLLHSNNTYFSQLLKKLYPKNELQTITRDSAVYSEGGCRPYPFQMNLHGLSPQTITECLVGFAKRKHDITPKNFHDWILKYFGTGIAKHFMFPYNEKLLACNLRKISPSWNGKYVPQTSINDLLTSLIEKPELRKVGYNNTFQYPKKGGIQTLVNGLKKQIKTKIQTGYEATRISLKHKTIYFANGHVEYFDTLITTLPLNVFLKKLDEPAHTNIRTQRKHLSCTSVINVNLGFDKQNISDKHWIYLPEKDIIPYRFGFWNNFASSSVPKDCSALYGELSFTPGQYSWPELKKRTDKAVSQIRKILRLKKANVIAQKILYIPQAYVRYTHWREQNLPALHARLNENNISSVGRYGSWKYSSMQDAILDGKATAQTIIKKLSKPARPTRKTTKSFVPAHPPSPSTTQKAPNTKELQGTRPKRTLREKHEANSSIF